MADFGISEILLAAAAGAAATGGTAAFGAIEKNKAVKSSKASAKRAATEEAKQIQDAADLERKKAAQESARIRGRLAVVAGASGADPSGSYSVLDNQAQTDLESNLDIITRNQRLQTNRVASQLNAQLDQIGSNRRNVLLDAFAGTVQGAATGIQIGNALKPSGPVDNPDGEPWDPLLQ